jgi:hypothetical protein
MFSAAQLGARECAGEKFNAPFAPLFRESVARRAGAEIGRDFPALAALLVKHEG